MSLNDNDAKLLETGLELLMMNQKEATPVDNNALLVWLGIPLTVIIIGIILGGVAYWCKCRTQTLQFDDDRGADKVEENQESVQDSKWYNYVYRTKG